MSTAEALESVLLLELPEAEVVVDRHRRRLDPVTLRGVPAHLTALFPFMSPADIDDRTEQRIAAVAAWQQPFDVDLATTGWFDDHVLYLAPADPDPFVRLTRALVETFPAYPPYGGAYADPVPHLTIGQGDDLPALRAAEQAVLAELPVRGRVAQLTLMVESDDGAWRRRRTFPLGHR